MRKTLRPDTLQPRWARPHTVIVTTSTAAKFLGHTSPYHLSHLKPFRATTSSQWEIQQTGLLHQILNAKMPPLPPVLLIIPTHVMAHSDTHSTDNYGSLTIYCPLLPEDHPRKNSQSLVSHFQPDITAHLHSSTCGATFRPHLGTTPLSSSM